VNQGKSLLQGSLSALAPNPLFLQQHQNYPGANSAASFIIISAQNSLFVSGFEGRVVLIDGQRTAQPGRTLSPLLKDLHPTTLQTSEQAS
jgi:hypothetical protein